MTPRRSRPAFALKKAKAEAQVIIEQANKRRSQILRLTEILQSRIIRPVFISRFRRNIPIAVNHTAISISTSGVNKIFDETGVGPYGESTTIVAVINTPPLAFPELLEA